MSSRLFGSSVGFMELLGMMKVLSSQVCMKSVVIVVVMMMWKILLSVCVIKCLVDDFEGVVLVCFGYEVECGVVDLMQFGFLVVLLIVWCIVVEGLVDYYGVIFDVSYWYWIEEV